MLFVRICGATMEVEKKMAFLLFVSFWLKILQQLNIKVVHNLITKSSGIILTPCDMFMPFYTFLLFLVSEVSQGEKFAHFWRFLAYFC